MLIPNDFKTTEELKAFLDRQSDLYYNEGEPEISDREFDALMRQYEILSGETYDTTTAPPVDPRYATTEHNFGHLTGRTRKAYNLAEVDEWLAETNPTNQSIMLLVTDKYDGNSGVAEFDFKGNLVKFLTRGKDGKGLDLTSIFASRKLSKKILDKMKEKLGFTHPDNTFALKVEMVADYATFDAINQMYAREKPYSNPRNLVAGILRSGEAVDWQDRIDWAPLRTDASIANYDRVTDWSFIQEYLVHNSDLGTISEMKYEVLTGTNEEILAALETYYTEMIESGRETREYMTDGLVLEYIDAKTRESLGRVGDINKFDIALKFPNLTEESEIVDIEFYQGKTGRITPVAVFKPVYFNGAKCDHVSLSNYTRFKELNLAVGSKVIIEYHGDVLSYLVRAGKPEDDVNKPIPFIDECPTCGEDLFLNSTETFVSCENPLCPGNVVGRLVNYTEKMGLKGINYAVLDRLSTANLVTKPEDLYTLNLTEAISQGIFQEKGAKVFSTALDMNKTPFDYEVLGSLMFTSLGRTKMKEICKVYSYNDILNMTDLELQANIAELPGFNTVTANYFVEGRKKNLSTLQALPNHLTIKPYKDSLKVAANAMKVVFTGFRDKDLKDRLELDGHKVTGKTSSKTTVVIAADPTSTSSSVKIAREHGIPVLTVAEFKAKYNY